MSNNRNQNKNQRTKTRTKKVEREQPRKDSSTKRVNLDNVREDKLERDLKYQDRPGKGYTKPKSSSADNDVAWYSKNPEMLKAAGSIPFASIIGNQLTWDVSTTGQFSRVPGIMSIAWAPAIGGSESDYYAMNQAATSTYSYLVHANSRNYSYEAADLMIAIMAGAQVFSLLSSVIRAYGVAMQYDEPNLYKPDVLLSSMGFDPQSFRRNLGQIWFDINELINRSKQIWIPNTMPVLMRWFWMNGNIFMDAGDPKAQMYLYVQNMYTMYNPTAQTTGGGLTPVTVKTTVGGTLACTPFTPAEKTYTWDEWMQVANEMMDALLSDEDRGIMYGDILNAYGADHIYALPTIEAGYRIAFNYSQEVLSQFENAIFSPVYQTGCIQNNGLLIPTWNKLSAGSGSNNLKIPPTTQVLNFHFPNQPTPEDIMVATRMKPSGFLWNTDSNVYTTTFDTADEAWVVAQNSGYTMGTCGTEIAQFMTIWMYGTYDAASGSAGTRYKGVLYGRADVADSSAIMWLIQSFDWHPFIYKTEALTSNPATKTYLSQTAGATGDYCNYTLVDRKVLRKLHDTALYSEFGVPQM